MIKTMRAWNIVVSVSCILLGIATILLSRKFPIELGEGDPGSGFWPTVLGIIIIALGLLLIVLSILGKHTKLATDLHMSSPVALRVYWMIGLTLMFGVVMYIAGLHISLFLFVYLAMGVMGVQNKRERLLISVIFVVSVFLIFQVLLKSPLPPPIFMR